MPKRYIPAEIRRRLRREVNWGCPVEECGSPFLTYHHFAPPFRDFTEQTNHNPEEMIALCLHHAALADGGVYTEGQIQEMKIHPFLNSEIVSGRNEWLRRDTVLCGGSNLFFDISTLLKVNGGKIIWSNRNLEGYLELSMEIADSHGNPIFLMENNDWLISGPLIDLQVTPRGRDIIIRSQVDGFWISLKFTDLDQDAMRSQIEDREIERVRSSLTEQNEMIAQLRAQFPDAKNLPEEIIMDEVFIRAEAWDPIKKIISEWPALEITFEGRLPPPIEMISTSQEMKMMGLTMTGSIFIGPISVFSIGAAKICYENSDTIQI